MDSATPHPTPSAKRASKGGSSARHLIGIFIAPRETFAEIASRPRWVVPLLVAWIASMSVGYLFAHRVFTDQAVERVARTVVQRDLAQQGSARSPTEEEIRIRAESVQRLKRLWPVGTTVELLVLVFGISLLFLWLMRILGERPGYRASVAVTSWSWMVWTVVFAVLAWLRVGLADPATLDPTDPYTLSLIHLGHFVPARAPRLLRVVATNLSLQNLWFLGLLAVGGAVLARRASAARIAGWTFAAGLVVFVVRGLVGF
jgi:hypothetical protein